MKSYKVVLDKKIEIAFWDLVECLYKKVEDEKCNQENKR